MATCCYEHIRDPCEDYVEVHDGPSLSSPVLRKLCGRFIRFFLQTTTNSAFIVFHSDNHTSLEDVGFKAFYAAIGKDPTSNAQIFVLYKYVLHL